MKTLLTSIFVVFLLSIGIAQATTSTTYFTSVTPDIQSFGILHIGVDNYFTVLRKQSNGAGSFPTDSGLTIGILPFQKIQMEIGVDLLQPYDYPFALNGKIGSPENALFKGSPAFQLGFTNFGVGHRNIANNITSADVIFGVIGKTIPHLARFSAGPYIGNGKVLVDKNGNKENTGYMVAFDRGFLPVKGKGGDEYNRIVLAADYASGKNAFGGGGVGLYYFFTKDISLLTGPVWFNEQAINGKWKWTMQLDINLSLFHK